MVPEQPVVMHQARWVIPMAGPVIADGAIAVAGDRIVAVGPAAAIRQDWRDNGLEADGFVFHDHGNGAIIPALVNTHLHLEFTALRRAVPPQADLPAWLQAAIEAFIVLTPQEIERGVREGLAELRRFGTVLGAEVSNTGRSLPLLVASGLDFHYFYECLGFDLLSRDVIGGRFSLPGPGGNCFLAGERRSPCPLFCVGAAVSPDQDLESGAGAADERAFGGIPAGKSFFARRPGSLAGTLGTPGTLVRRFRAARLFAGGLFGPAGLLGRGDSGSAWSVAGGRGPEIAGPAGCLVVPVPPVQSAYRRWISRFSGFAGGRRQGNVWGPIPWPVVMILIYLTK